MGLLSYTIHKHSSRSQHISVLKLRAHLCFDKFAPLNLLSLKGHRGCIVDPSRYLLRIMASSFSSEEDEKLVEKIVKHSYFVAAIIL